MRIVQSIAALCAGLSVCVASGLTTLPAFPQIMPLPAPAPGAVHPPAVQPAPHFGGTGSGILQGKTKDGKTVECPLKHTDVTATISGYVARVTVKQEFTNPFKQKIDAVYTFPLSDSGAVDEMYMRVGGRTIHGTIKKREEAHQIYEQARASGHVAALLDQERTNIFTQSVANIEPGKSIEVTLSYVDLLPYSDGQYSFVFPTVVGPRFNPGKPTGHSGSGVSADTTQVPDGSKISPPVAAAGERSGHDIDISVDVNAGLPIGHIDSQLHKIHVVRSDSSHARVTLDQMDRIPNKDFVLTWGVAADKLHTGYLTNRKNGHGYFELMIMPPKRVEPANVQPKEMIYLIDCSGSQRGKPLEKAKEAMIYALDHMNPQDTFQVIAFNSIATRLFERPRTADSTMRDRAKEFVNSLQAQGGTWMAPAVETACKEPSDNHRLRIVVFMTDGYVGNDLEIVGMVRKLRGTSRWFPFGTGNSVNRFLIDNIAKEGGGEPDYVYLNSSAEEVGKKFYEKISSPVLTDVKINWDGLDVKEVFPHELCDVWAQRPLYVVGRYAKPGNGTVTISGFSGGKPYEEKIEVQFPENENKNDVLGSVWARAKVDRLMAEDWIGAQSGKNNKELRDEIVATALEHHIMTQYTSFVAVEEKRATKRGESKTVEVPVEMPDGVSRDGIHGEQSKKGGATIMSSSLRFKASGGMFANTGTIKPMPAAAPLAMASAGATTGAGAASMYTRSHGLHAQMQPPPPPMLSGGNGGSASVAGPGTIMTGSPLIRGNYYNAPAQMMYADEGGAIDKLKAPLSENEKKRALSKLSESLRALAEEKNPPANGSLHGALLHDGRVRVKVVLKDIAQNKTWGLHQCGQVEALIVGDSCAIMEVSVSELLALAANENVVSVEVASN